MSHQFTVRVYYEDTDFGGIVYYANYLKFIERARSEWVRELGIDQIALKSEGIVFAVRRINADYLRPAYFDDLLTVTTAPDAASPARMTLDQTITRDGVRIFSCKLTMVTIGLGGRPVRLPAKLRRSLPKGV